jgi:oligopeptide/dipeptide ABC transporter ATP-binding protein
MTAVEPVLSARELTKQFGRPAAPDAVRPGFRDVSLDLYPGECVGLVGESGCGKTTLGRALTRMLDPDGGELRVAGRDFGRLRGRDLRASRHIVQMVFQRPETSLNPRMTVAGFVGEVFRNFRTAPRGGERRRLEELVEMVGLTNDHLDRYPHQLSGGEKQRVGIMRALACDPLVLVLDEPTSALDVSVQAQVLQTLREITARTSMAVLFISHDIAVIRYMCSRVLVMYLGQIVEEGPSASLFAAPVHPYTRALFEAVPRLGAQPPPSVVLTGETTTAGQRASACPLIRRCPFAWDRCRSMPPMVEIRPGHRAACWLHVEVAERAPAALAAAD